MNVETVREYCLSKKGATESFPFDDVSLVIKVMNKMFALIDLEGANSIALKCDPEKAIELREHYAGIEGAYHFNKKYWNSVRFDSDADDKLINDFRSHWFISMKRTLPTIICKLFAHDNKQKSSLLWLQTFKRPDEDNVAIRGKQNLIRTFFSVL